MRRWRGLVGELRGIHEQLTRQTELLARLVDHYAPQLDQLPPEQVQRETGVDYLDPIEAAIVIDYQERTRQDTGRDPSAEEVLSYLADEKTIDLHQRLREREERVAQRLRERER